MKLIEIIKLLDQRPVVFSRRSEDEYYNDIDLCIGYSRIRTLTSEDLEAQDWEIQNLEIKNENS